MIVKIASALLAIQNIAFVLVLVTANDYFEYILYLDLIGFSLLGIGFFLLSREYRGNQRKFLMASGGVVGWLTARIYWQFSIGLDALSGTRFIIAFGLSASFLLISGLSRINNRYYLFTLFNFIISMMAIFVLISLKGNDVGLNSDIFGIGLLVLLAKVLVVPLFAISSFISLYRTEFDLLIFSDVS